MVNIVTQQSKVRFLGLISGSNFRNLNDIVGREPAFETSLKPSKIIIGPSNLPSKGF